MNTCSTCGTHAKTFDLGIPQTELSPARRDDEKLNFVERVLGVLIDSRYGDSNPYTRLGERNVTTGDSQMFSNVRLLTAAEINAHLECAGAHHRPFNTALLGELPLASANGFWLQNISGFSPKAAWAKAREVLDALNRWLKPTAIQRTQHDHSSMPRGSPTFNGRAFFRSPTATCIKA